MAAYVFAKIHVTDWDRYEAYTKVTPGVVARDDGRFIARGGDVVTLEGPEEDRRAVLIEFPSLE